jgi:hypothetical protein
MPSDRRHGSQSGSPAGLNDEWRCPGRVHRQSRWLSFAVSPRWGLMTLWAGLGSRGFRTLAIDGRRVAAGEHAHADVGMAPDNSGRVRRRRRRRSEGESPRKKRRSGQGPDRTTDTRIGLPFRVGAKDSRVNASDIGTLEMPYNVRQCNSGRSSCSNSYHARSEDSLAFAC